jgi:hypothetical protein
MLSGPRSERSTGATLRRRACTCLLLLPFLSCCRSEQTPAAKALVELAPKIKFLCRGAFLDDASPRFGLEASPEFWEWRGHLAEPVFGTPDLVPVLHHSNPRVRSLALIALAAKEDPHVLPALNSLADDPASSYPCPTPTDNYVPPERAPMDRQTVGEIATFIVLRHRERERQPWV